MNVKKILSIFLVFIVVFSFTSCGKNNEEKVSKDEIKIEKKDKEDKENEELDLEKELENNDNSEDKLVKFWGGSFPEESSFYDEFKKETGYTIECKVPDCNGEKLISAIASGAPPDALFIGMGEVIPLAANKALRPIDDFIKSSDVNLDDFYKFLIDLGYYDGKHYSLPWDVEFTLLYWNKDLFEQEGLDPDTPPETWEEFKEYSKLLTKYNSKGEISQLGYAASKGWSGEYRWFLDTLVMSNGGSFLSEDGRRSNFNSPEVIETFEFLLDLESIYGSNDKIPEENNINFRGGKAAMMLGDAMWYWDVAVNDELQVGISVPPYKEGKDPVSGGWATWALVLPEKSKNPQGGFEFAKWMATKGSCLNQKAFQEKDAEQWPGCLMAYKPLNKELNEEAKQTCVNEYKLKNQQDKVKVFEKYVKAIPSYPVSNEMGKELFDFWEKMWDKEVTIKDGVMQIDKKLNSIIEDYYKDRKNMGIDD